MILEGEESLLIKSPMSIPQMRKSDSKNKYMPNRDKGKIEYETKIQNSIRISLHLLIQHVSNPAPENAAAHRSLSGKITCVSGRNYFLPFMQ